MKKLKLAPAVVKHIMEVVENKITNKDDSILIIKKTILAATEERKQKWNI